mgnify:CR=1 FL=1
MDVTKQYAIAWKGLKNGTYRFDFKVDNALFEAYGSTDIKDGDLSVGVTLERGESMLSLQTVIRGTVTVAWKIAACPSLSTERCSSAFRTKSPTTTAR